MRKPFTARYSDGAEFLLHAIGQAQSARHQRAQRQRAQNTRRVQGLAWSGLRLLFDQTVAARQEDEKRCQKLSDRTSLDDQPLMRETQTEGDPNASR